jgi:uncharacterized protein involved in exopolysaccharide biosynthesis
MRRYAMTFGLPLMAIWGLALAYAFLTPKSYLSEIVLNMPNATVQSSVSLQNIGQTSINAASPFASSSLSPIVFYKSIALSNGLRVAAAELMNIDEKAMPKPKVQLIDLTAIMTIQVTGPNPKLAQSRTKAFYEALQNQLDELRRDEAVRRLDAIRSGVTEVESRLAETSKQLQQFQQTSAIVSRDQFDLIVRNFETLRQKISAEEAELEKTVAERKRLSALLGLEPADAAAALQFQSDPRYSNLSRALGEAMVDYTEKTRKWGPRHPQVVTSAKRIETIQLRLQEIARSALGDRTDKLFEQLILNDSRERSQLLRTLVEVDSRASGLQSSLRQMNKALGQSTRFIEERTEQLAELAELERQHKIAETVFASAVARIDTSGQDFYSSYPLLQIVTPATLPEKPNSPKVLFALIGAFAGSILLITSMVLAWLRQPFIRKILKNA